MWIYYSCIFTISSDSKFKIDERANKILRNYIIANPESYLKMFIRQYLPIDIHTITAEPFFDQIFDGYENFETFIKEQNINGKYQFIVDFYEKFKNNNYKPVTVENPDYFRML